MLSTFDRLEAEAVEENNEIATPEAFDMSAFLNRFSELETTVNNLVAKIDGITKAPEPQPQTPTQSETITETVSEREGINNDN